MAAASERFNRIFTCAFVWFFLAPVVAVVVVVPFAPDLVTYDNSGLFLLLSVVCGGLFGALVGLIEYPVGGRTDASDVLWIDDLWDPDVDVHPLTRPGRPQR